MKYALTNPPRYVAESPLGEVKFFYSPAVAAWFERLEKDLILMRAKRTGQTVDAVIEHFRRERATV